MKTLTLVSMLLLSLLGRCSADRSEQSEITIAVASNFANAMTSIAGRYEERTGQKITLIFGSTGKHYSQIRNGAPYDAFFAADTLRPELLEKQELTVANSRFTYAVGKIVLWSPHKTSLDLNLHTGSTSGALPFSYILNNADFNHLALANPKLAPYGYAAMQILQSLEIWDKLQNKLVFGESIGQAFQFVQSANAELGFVAFAQVKTLDDDKQGSMWMIPPLMYSPIRQQAVLLKKSDATLSFLQFMKGEEALQIIREYGYDVP